MTPPVGPAAYPDQVMSSSSPGSPPPADGLPSVVRRHLGALARSLAHPSHPPTPLLAGASRRWQRLAPYLVVTLLTALFVPATFQILTMDYQVGRGPAALLALAQAGPLLMLAHRPLQAWWIVFGADVVGALVLLAPVSSPAPVPLPPLRQELPWPWSPTVVISYLFVLLALGLRETRRTLLAVWLTTGTAGLLLYLIAPERDASGVVLLPVLGAVVLVITAALRERGEAQRRLVEQETISETERAGRTLLEERTRIARELHDVVAHHMSVITVQADSAPYRISGLPEQAREEFGSIAASARESLTEMRRLLSVLRSDGTEGERAPQPGLDRIQQLVEATVRSGLPVELSMGTDVPGSTEDGLPQAVDLSAYRIVQEALANVVRHAPGARTRVSVTAAGSHLTVLVVNDRAQRPGSPLEATGTGHGLVGMRERVRLTGGTLDTGPLPDGGFRVAARLPLSAPVVSSASLASEDP
ncbi:sensor histidine kinase [Streptomyces sp. SID8360]|nr:integral membrane sensor signal transduction histidine kinase [Streptomyces sp. SirexAA-E]MYR64735.1 sensor histidine kinase [Streptomyces sp. SID4939]MYS01496.1 sensor histidine kinase [Streptomyces sp. SID4940]MYT64367.1 sensor histidine kinase [Streptomyces sp. SID8357]MYT87180.1 sensor histidine kinase [Streptomyces sp. SID8360]MYW37257.1 sensor histidine kinase [Streptomyces sp. SID1]PZX44867.1 signal transduction histidine kinase [Streptomyces sp. DvalAA-21]RAJ32527.1 signal transdu